MNKGHENELLQLQLSRIMLATAMFLFLLSTIKWLECCRENESSYSQDYHLTLVCLPTAQVQSSQVQACTRVDRKLLWTLYKGLHPVPCDCRATR